MISCRADLFRRLKRKPTEQELTGCTMIVAFEKLNETDWLLRTIDFSGANDQDIERPWCKDMEIKFESMLKADGFKENVNGMLFKEARGHILLIPVQVRHRDNWTADGVTHQTDSISCREFYRDFM